MKSTHLLRNLAVFALLACTPVLLFGQAVNFAQIQGRVFDATGASLAGATVTATQVSTGLVRTASTSTDGHYVLPNLPVGPYQLKVSAAGFRDYLQKGIVLQVGEQPTVNVTMQVGTVAETVEVRANAAMVETHDNAVSTMIDNARIMEMPLNGRNVVDLVMGAGFASNTTLVSQDLLSSKNYGNGLLLGGPSQAISVAGGQQNANNYLLDGGDNNDAFSNVNSPFPFPDAIQEFSVQSSGGSARFGVHAGAVVNAVTKSGTNAWHGSAFEYLRNPILNAHHVFFDPPLPGSKDDTMKRNQFGGTVGGPIERDKLFIFAGYQGTRQSASAPLTSVKVPTAAVLAGDWRNYFACSGTPCLKKSLKAPFVGNTTTGYTINPALYSPQALAILQHIPLATTPTGDMSFTYPQVVNEDQGVAKLDWSISPKQTFFTRYFATDFRSPIPYDDANILPQGVASSQFARYQSLAFSHTYTLSERLVNSLHVTGTRLAINRGPAGEMINPAGVGINVPSPIPNGLVLSVSSGYFTTGGGSQMPGHFNNNLYQVADDVDIIKGKHQLSFGVNFMKMQLNYLSTYQSNGQFTFGAGSTVSGDNLTDFLLGRPSNFLQSNDELENWRYTYVGLYAHDNIKLLSNLTLNVGVRWEPYLPSVDIMHRGSHFDYAAFVAGTHSTVYPNAPAGLFYCGDPGIPCAFANKKMAQFSPRVGLIWDPTKKGNLTVRASYGLFYDSPEMYYFDRYADNSPFGSVSSFVPSAAGGLANPYLGQAAPKYPQPFPKAGDPSAYFPVNGVYINNDSDVRPTYVQNWNLSIEKQFGANWLVSATYMGSKTTHIWAAYEANPGMNVRTVATPAASAGGSGCTANQNPSTTNTNCRRALVVANPSQGQYFANLTSLWDGADANYHALLLSARHRFANNFTFLTNYTWSHCISDQDFSGELTNSRPVLYPSPVTDPNPANLALDRGNCGFDVRHSWNGSLVVSSPRFQGTKGMFLNNWQFAPLLSYRTGQVYDIRTGVDTALIASTTAFKDRPNLVGDPFTGTCTRGVVTYAVGTRNCWFNSTLGVAFVAPTAGTYGTLMRNAFYGPGAFRFDGAVSRKFNITERKELQLRLEVFNVLNHPVLGNPVVAMNNANFGRIQTQVGDGRTFQGAIKFSF
jgi:hypothetical protein